MTNSDNILILISRWPPGENIQRIAVSFVLSWWPIKATGGKNAKSTRSGLGSGGVAAAGSGGVAADSRGPLGLRLLRRLLRLWRPGHADGHADGHGVAHPVARADGHGHGDRHGHADGYADGHGVAHGDGHGTPLANAGPADRGPPDRDGHRGAADGDGDMCTAAVAHPVRDGI